MREWSSVAIVFLLLSPVCAFAQGDPASPPPVTGPRDNAKPKETGSARVSGRVVNGETGMPLRRALVTLMGEPLKQPRAGMTDEQGRYEIRDLPAGRYSVSINKTGYIQPSNGRRLQAHQRLLELRDGEASTRVDFQLQKSGVITGRVTDELGEPLANVGVRAMRFSSAGGKRRLGQVAGGSTDDRGQFRIFGLAAGDYYVSAVYSEGTEFLQSDSIVGYAPTYYPGTPSEADAQRVRVRAGAEQGPLNFALIPARGVKVSGTVLMSTGQPAPLGFLVLQSGSPEDGIGDMRGGTMLQSDGSFSLANITPGDYLLYANFGMGQEDDNAESGAWPISVLGEDLEGLTFTTSKPTRISGQLVFDGTPPRDARPAEFMLWAQPTDHTRMMFGGGGRVTVKEDWTLEGRGSHGPLTLNVGSLREGWTLKAVLLNGEDVTDTGFPTTGELVEGLQVILTNRLTKLSGSATDDAGKPAREYQVVIFPEDASLWRRLSRRQTMAVADQQGRFEVSSLPPGHYLAAAIDELEEGQEADPEFLESLRASATAFELAEGETKTIALRMSRH